MPRNQTSTKTNVTGAGTARAAKPGTRRGTASKHSKAAAAEATIVVKEAPHEEVKEIIASLMEAAPQENPMETISRLAYGYWEKRGGQGGDPIADWVRAENEYRKSLSVA